MPASQEPRDGDFVAYIEELQRASAARIRAQAGATTIEFAPHPTHEAGGASAARKADVGASGHAAPVLDAREAQELIARLARSRPAARLVSGGAAAAIGTLLLLYSVLGNGGALPFLIGLGLLLWAVPRVRRALREIPPSDRQHARRIAETFGRRPPHA